FAAGKVLLLGVDFRSCTLLHTAEEVARVPLIDFETRYPARGRAAGRDYTVRLYSHSAPPAAHFPAIDPALDSAGALHRGRVGNADSRLFRAGDLLDVALERLADDPEFLRRP